MTLGEFANYQDEEMGLLVGVRISISGENVPDDSYLYNWYTDENQDNYLDDEYSDVWISEWNSAQWLRADVSDLDAGGSSSAGVEVTMEVGTYDPSTFAFIPLARSAPEMYSSLSSHISRGGITQPSQTQWSPTVFYTDILVPEPTTVALLSLGAVALLLRRRVRRRAKPESKA